MVSDNCDGTCDTPSPAERRAQRACSLAGGGHSSDNPLHVTGHLSGLFPHHDGPEEASVRGHLQPQLTGSGWSQTGDGQCPQSAPRGKIDLRSAAPLVASSGRLCSSRGMKGMSGFQEEEEEGVKPLLVKLLLELQR